jgi:hypothetical protein
MKTLFLIFALSTAALGCGVPQDITGRVWAPVWLRATVTITPLDSPDPPIAIPTMAFGYFAAPEMTPCVDYLVTVDSKWFDYEPLVFTLPGEGPVNLQLHPIF